MRAFLRPRYRVNATVHNFRVRLLHSLSGSRDVKTSVLLKNLGTGHMAERGLKRPLSKSNNEVKVHTCFRVHSKGRVGGEMWWGHPGPWNGKAADTEAGPWDPKELDMTEQLTRPHFHFHSVFYLIAKHTFSGNHLVVLFLSEDST